MNGLDPSGFDAIWLFDTECYAGGILPTGHSALLVGDFKNGWEYFSIRLAKPTEKEKEFASGSDQATVFQFHVDKYFQNFGLGSSWKNGGYNFNKAILIPTTREQDRQMIEDMKVLKRAGELGGNQYRLLGNNCLTQPANMLSVNGVSVPSWAKVSAGVSPSPDGGAVPVHDYQLVATPKGALPKTQSIRPSSYFELARKGNWFEKNSAGFIIPWPLDDPSAVDVNRIEAICKKLPANSLWNEWVKDQRLYAQQRKDRDNLELNPDDFFPPPRQPAPPRPDYRNGDNGRSPYHDPD